MSTFVPQCAVPAFPGAMYKLLSCLLCAIFQAKACSLPPDPKINTFIVKKNAKIENKDRIRTFFSASSHLRNVVSELKRFQYFFLPNLEFPCTRFLSRLAFCLSRYD